MNYNKNKKRKIVLLIDDHPPLIRDFTNLISVNLPDESFVFESALDCKSAYEKVMGFIEKDSVPEIAVIDMQLPEYVEQHLFSGLEVGLLIQKHFPTTKIIIATGFTDITATKTIIEKLQPEAILCKTDIEYDTYGKVFNILESGKTFISKTIQTVLQEDWKDKLGLDDFDFQILHYLKTGVATKDLPDFIEMSLSGIKKRKAILKVILIGEKCSDTELLAKAKELGIV